MVGPAFEMELLNEAIQTGKQYLVSDCCPAYVQAHVPILHHALVER